MKWYPFLYFGECAGRKKKRILYKLKTGAGMLDIWLVTEAANGRDVFDIISSGWLKQKAVRKNLPEVIGIAKGYEEAVELVKQIVDETYAQTGTGDVKGYLEQKRKRVTERK